MKDEDKETLQRLLDALSKATHQQVEISTQLNDLREDFKKIQEAIHGNGQTGLKVEVALIKSSVEQLSDKISLLVIQETEGNKEKKKTILTAIAILVSLGLGIASHI